MKIVNLMGQVGLHGEQVHSKVPHSCCCPRVKEHLVSVNKVRISTVTQQTPGTIASIVECCGEVDRFQGSRHTWP